jgi:hypothetical protein
MKSASKSTMIGAGLLMALSGPVAGQSGPPPASSLEDITACSLDGDSVFVVNGRDAAARRYKYPWDAAIDALCNGKGFAIGAPARIAAPPPVRAALPTATGAAAASGGPTEFPADAQPVSAADLARKVSGRVFNVELQNGIRWRLDYKANGYLFVNVSNGMATSGPWRAEEGRLCTHMRGSSASCNEVREQGQRLYVKRDNGDVIALNPQ